MLKNVVVPLSLLLLSGVAARPPPPGWRASDPTEAAARSLQDEIELTFLLKIAPARVSTLESEVLARADPSSASYGKPHLTNDEVHAMVAPAVEHVQAVTSYREQGGGGRETTTLDPTPLPLSSKPRRDARLSHPQQRHDHRARSDRCRRIHAVCCE